MEFSHFLSRISVRAGLLLAATVVLTVACEKTSVPSGKIPVTTTSQDALKYFLEGRALALELRSAEARTRFAKAIERDSNFALAYLEMARNAPSSKMSQSYLKRAMALSEDVSEGERLCIQAVHAYSIQGRPQKARALYARLVELYPKDEMSHLWLAVHYFLQQDHRNCLKVCSSALEVSPDYAPVYNLLGYAHQALGDYGAAEEAFKRYIGLIPAEPNPYDSYADLLLKTGRFEEAIDMYEQALEINPGFTASIRGIAAALNGLGQYEEARRRLNKVLDRTNQPAIIHTISEAIAISFVEQRRFDSAAVVLLKARDDHFSRADTISAANTIILVGDLYLEAGKAVEARQYYEDAITAIQESGVDDDVKQNASIQYQYNIGRVAITEDKLDSADVLAELHLEAAKERVDPVLKAQAHFLKAAIALKRGEFDKALEHCEMTDTHNPYHQFQKSIILLGLKRESEAKALNLEAQKANLKHSFPLAFVKAHRQDFDGASEEF